MAIEIKDERDRKREGLIKETSELKKRAEAGDYSAGKALSERVRELDQTVLHTPDPKYAYRFGSNEKKGRVGQLKGLGYEVVPLDAKEQAVAGYEQDGAQTVGSMILMRTKRENYERRRANSRTIYEMQTGAFMEKAKENMNKAAREGGFVGPNQDIAIDDSSES
jgi:hypothetical protein